MEKIKVLIVDDHSLFREGLAQLLSLEEDLEVVGEARDGEECLQKVKELEPDVILLDINMPNVNGIMALRKLKDMDQATKVIILTFHEEIEYLFEAFNLGANGYIVKDADSGILIHGIHEVYKGQPFVYPTVAEGNAEHNNIKRYTDNADQVAQKVQLTKREYEILTLIADGLNNKEIANTLFISEKTVKNHVSNIFKKIKVKDRTQAAIYAYRNKIKSI